jgi:hypothetical protein
VVSQGKHDKSRKKGKAPKASDYLDEIDTDDLTIACEPQGKWHRVHGDGKSTSGGIYHLETMMTSYGDYLVKIVGAGIAEAAKVNTSPWDEPMPASVVRAAKVLLSRS